MPISTKIISEESCGTKNWGNDAKIQLCITGIHNLFVNLFNLRTNISTRNTILLCIKMPKCSYTFTKSYWLLVKKAAITKERQDKSPPTKDSIWRQ